MLLKTGGTSLERNDRTLAWPPNEDDVMEVAGYQEVLHNADLFRLPGGEQILVASIPGLALLKLFAWRDRRLTSPGKDAEDVRFMLYNFLAAGNEDRLYSNETHMFESQNYDYELAGAWMLGRDIGKELDVPGHQTRALAIDLLRAQIDELGQLEFEMGGDVDMNSRMLRALTEGLSGSQTPSFN